MNLKHYSLLVLMTMLSSFSLAANTALLRTNDLSPDGVGYKVTGPDPYFVFNAASNLAKFDASSNTLSLALNISSKQNEQSVELFYLKDADLETRFKFKPFQKIQFFVPANTDNGFALVVPEDVDMGSASFLRLDINNCLTCTVSFSKNRETMSKKLGKVIHSFTGLNEIPHNGFEITTLGWEANDLVPVGDGNQAVGLDPYLVSPHIDIDTSSLGGVALNLSVTNFQSAVHDFQFFYQTGVRGFKESSSTIVRTLSDEGSVEIFVPLTYLNSELPTKQVLERLRLDFPPNTENNHDEVWHLDRVRFLHREQLSEYKPKGNSRFFHKKMQQPGKRRLLQSIGKKIASDLPFLISYLVLLIAVFVWLVLKVRAAARSR